MSQVVVSEAFLRGHAISCCLRGVVGCLGHVTSSCFSGGAVVM